jgi:hypothetical protein
MSSKGGFLFFAYKRQILVSPELIRITSKNIFLLFDYITQVATYGNKKKMLLQRTKAE